MSKIILISNPSNDVATKYLSSWTEEINKIILKRKNIKVFELKGEDSNKKCLRDIIEKENPDFVILNGHGNENSIFGFSEILIKKDENEGMLKNRIVHSMACNSAKELGRSCIRIGTKCFVGYSEKFILVHRKKETPKEKVEDPIAKFFLEPAFQVIIEIIKGKTTGEAYSISQNLYKRNLGILLTSNKTDLNTTVASRLYHNFKHQVCLGNTEVTL